MRFNRENFKIVKQICGNGRYNELWDTHNAVPKNHYVTLSGDVSIYIWTIHLRDYKPMGKKKNNINYTQEASANESREP